MRVGEHVCIERIHSLRQLFGINISFNVQLLNQNIKLFVVYDAIFVSINLAESGCHAFRFLTVFSQTILKN